MPLNIFQTQPPPSHKSDTSSVDNPYPSWHKMHRVLNLERAIKKSQEELSRLKASMGSKIKEETPFTPQKQKSLPQDHPPPPPSAPHHNQRKMTAREVNGYNSVALVQNGQKPYYPLGMEYERTKRMQQMGQQQYRPYQPYPKYPQTYQQPCAQYPRQISLQYQQYQPYPAYQAYQAQPHQPNLPSPDPSDPDYEITLQYMRNPPRKICPSPFDHLSTEDIDQLVAEGKTTWAEVEAIDSKCWLNA